MCTQYYLIMYNICIYSLHTNHFSIIRVHCARHSFMKKLINFWLYPALRGSKSNIIYILQHIKDIQLAIRLINPGPKWRRVNSLHSTQCQNCFWYHHHHERPHNIDSPTMLSKLEINIYCIWLFLNKLPWWNLQSMYIYRSFPHYG